MLLYVHVPFCRSKCTYCGFYSQKYDQEALNTYLELLRREIVHWSNLFPETTFDTLYLGGGTPSVLSLDQLTRLLEHLNNHFRFSPQLETTLEGNPESMLSLADFARLMDLGVNRVSLGVQSLDDNILRLLGRTHTRDQALESVSRLRDAGLRNLSLDFIWGIPGQTAEHWIDQLHKILSLGPEHLSCYGLTLEPSTPLDRAYARGELILPDEAEQEDIFLRTGLLLEQAGFEHYEISNFARPGFRSRHNTGYWNMEPYLGLGPGAVSTVQCRRWENPRDLNEYGRQVIRRTLGREYEEIDQPTQLQEEILLGLRTAQGFRISRYTVVTGRDFHRDFEPFLAELFRNGLAGFAEDRLFLTREGFLVSNEIIETFLSSPLPVPSL